MTRSFRAVPFAGSAIHPTNRVALLMPPVEEPEPEGYWDDWADWGDDYDDDDDDDD
jgi:hypothetical protein